MIFGEVSYEPLMTTRCEVTQAGTLLLQLYVWPRTIKSAVIYAFTHLRWEENSALLDY